MSTEHQISELLPFLLHPSPQVVSLSIVNLLPYTVPSSTVKHLFLDETAGPDNKGWLRVLAALARSSVDPGIGKSALNALVNLTDSLPVCTRVAKLPGFVQWLFKTIIDVNSPLADEACMLLSNLTQLEDVCTACLRIAPATSEADASDTAAQEQASATATSTPSAVVSETNDVKGKARASKQAVESLQILVDLFATEGLNKDANYDYLAHVFANISASKVHDGRESLLGMPASLEEGSDSPVPLSELVIFTEHKNPIRRAGVSSTLKNCAFVHEAHTLLLSSGKRVNFLPYILLPLCGPEEFDLDDQEKMPEEIQFLPSDKKRDQDPSTRLMLVETLILLCRTRSGRDTLRDRGTYPVIKLAHMAEEDDQIKEEMERLVNLLMRDESDDTKIEEVMPSSVEPVLAQPPPTSLPQQDEDEDTAVVEV